MLKPLWRGLKTCRTSSTAGERARMPVSHWRGRESAAKTSRAATSSKTLLRLHRRPQGVPDPRLGS
jgi:hypothetical protein